MTPMKCVTPATTVLLQRAGRLDQDQDGTMVMLTNWPPGHDHPAWVERTRLVVRQHKAFDWDCRIGWKWVP